MLTQGQGQLWGSVWGTVVAVDPQQVVQHAPVQRQDGAHHQNMHDLVAVTPVVKETWTETFRDTRDVDEPTQHCQRVHGEEVSQGGGAAAAYAHPAQQEEREAEKSLPGEGAHSANTTPSRYGAVDGVAGEQDVDKQGHGADERVTQQGDVDDRQST